MKSLSIPVIVGAVVSIANFTVVVNPALSVATNTYSPSSVISFPSYASPFNVYEAMFSSTNSGFTGLL